MHAKAHSTTGTATLIPAGATVTLDFAFDPAEVQSELASGAPAISLSLVVSKPVSYTDVLQGPLAGP